MSPISILAILAVWSIAHAAEIAVGIAYLRPTKAFFKPEFALAAPASKTRSKTAVMGYMKFTQKVIQVDGKDQKVIDVTGEISGLPAGIHGLHIHQYGDESDSGMGRHFIPTCSGPPGGRRRLDDIPDGGTTAAPDPCLEDSIHGLPPSKNRQNGDMGNVIVPSNGVVKLPGAFKEVKSGRFAQNKMSLNGDLTSILGRGVALHWLEDIGTAIPLYDDKCSKTCGVCTGSDCKDLPSESACQQTQEKNKCALRLAAKYINQPPLEGQTVQPDPFGAAGPAIVSGVVGRIFPESGDTDISAPPNPDTIDYVVCRLRSTQEPGISGLALLQAIPFTDKTRLQAQLEHPTSFGGEKSFHFHYYAGTTGNDGWKNSVGPIFKSTIDLNTLKIQDGTSSTIFDDEFVLAAQQTGIDNYVGRVLTIHEGKSENSPTIAYGTCGIANPSTYELLNGGFKYPEANNAFVLSVSTAVLLLAVFVTIF